MLYRRVPTSQTEPSPKDVGPVLHFPWVGSVEFRCPCGEQVIYVTQPPHGIIFDEDGRLTLDGSCGSHEQPHLVPPQPANWCHFFVEGGKAKMCDDAQCPGSVMKGSEDEA